MIDIFFVSIWILIRSKSFVIPNYNYTRFSQSVNYHLDLVYLYKIRSKKPSLF